MTAFITRDTRVPTLTERLAGYFQRSAILRASAELGDEHALSSAPNVVALRPAHRLGKIEAITLAVRLHCRAERPALATVSAGRLSACHLNEAGR